MMQTLSKQPRREERDAKTDLVTNYLHPREIMWRREVQSCISLEYISACHRYSVLGCLGEGRSGVVFRVCNEIGCELALKTLKPGYHSHRWIPSLEREIHLCSKKIHPNVIRILDSGHVSQTTGRLPFHVMEIYPQTLEAILLGDCIDVNLLISFAIQILNGVEAFHLLGIRHRDLKAKNILCNAATGTAVVSDFGSAYSPSLLLRKQEGILKSGLLISSESEEIAEVYAAQIILGEIISALRGKGDRRNENNLPNAWGRLRTPVEATSLNQFTTIASMRREFLQVVEILCHRTKNSDQVTNPATNPAALVAAGLRSYQRS